MPLEPGHIWDHLYEAPPNGGKTPHFEAVATLGALASVTSKARPAGCFFKGNKVWFNTRTTVYEKGRYGKFTGVCKA